MIVVHCVRLIFTFEMYLTVLRPAERMCMSKFLTGNHNWPVSECIKIPIHVLCLTAVKQKFYDVLVCSFFKCRQKTVD